MQELAFNTKRRLLIISIGIYVICGLLFIRLFYLQFIRGADYFRQSMDNRTQIIKMPAYRSIVYDRSGENKLAFNRKSLSITAIPANLPEDNEQKEIVLSNASVLLGMSVEEIKNILKEQALWINILRLF